MPTGRSMVRRVGVWGWVVCGGGVGLSVHLGGLGCVLSQPSWGPGRSLVVGFVILFGSLSGVMEVYASTKSRRQNLTESCWRVSEKVVHLQRSDMR